MYQCDASVVGQCNENPAKFIEAIECDRFHADKSGPWHMLAEAMRGSRCAESLVSIWTNL